MKIYTYSRNTVRCVVIFSLLAVIFTGCRKEYTDYPYTDLTQFSVKDTAGAILKAVIKDQDVIIYWPPFQNIPDSVSPVISVAERASILPASGKKIPFKDGFEYKVTAQNGAVKTYKLKPAINQPDLGLITPTTSIIGASIAFSGNYFVPDINKTKISLISNTGVETVLQNIYSITQLIIWISPPEIPEGKYQIKLINGNYTVLPKDSLAITYTTSPLFTTTPVRYPVAVKRNQEYIYKISGTPVSKLTKLRFRLLADNTLHEVTIGSKNADNTVTIKIPANMPTGTYSAVEFSSSLFATPFIRNLAATARIVVSE